MSRGLRILRIIPFKLNHTTDFSSYSPGDGKAPADFLPSFLGYVIRESVDSDEKKQMVICDFDHKFDNSCYKPRPFKLNHTTDFSSYRGDGKTPADFHPSSLGYVIREIIAH